MILSALTISTPEPEPVVPKLRCPDLQPQCHPGTVRDADSQASPSSAEPELRNQYFSKPSKGH